MAEPSSTQEEPDNSIRIHTMSIGKPERRDTWTPIPPAELSLIKDLHGSNFNAVYSNIHLTDPFVNWRKHRKRGCDFTIRKADKPTIGPETKKPKLPGVQSLLKNTDKQQEELIKRPPSPKAQILNLKARLGNLYYSFVTQATQIEEEIKRLEEIQKEEQRPPICTDSNCIVDHTTGKLRYAMPVNREEAMNRLLKRRDLPVHLIVNKNVNS